MEIFDGAGVNQNEVEKLRNFFLELFRPRANFGAKKKVELQTFVLEGHPNPPINGPGNQVKLNLKNEGKKLQGVSRSGNLLLFGGRYSEGELHLDLLIDFRALPIFYFYG